jgi:7-cyano-7-deazaguanine synthase in queuosine biosynthesis
MVAETVILCGDAKAPRRTRKIVPLSVTGSSANVALQSEDIGRRMLRSLPSALADLLDVATYVYAADQLVSRGGETASRLGADWRRELRFIIPVREPDRWSSPEVTSSLERLLGFMSEDRVRFDFVGARDSPASSDYFDFESEIEEVVLFSGGLDSLTGAIDRLSTGKARLLLVSHQSSTKIAKRQKQLVRDLAERFPGRVVHVPVRISMHGIERVERTQRTRSFLFGALGAVVSRIAGAAGLSLFENGIVSFNLPIACQVVGAAATRTTHPRVIRDLAEFLSTLLEQQVGVDNPYVWKTKAEVAGLLRAAGHADLARHTVSCSRVYWMTRLHTHCGRCSQCLDRRFGTMAADLGEDDPAIMYETDLLTGAREEDLDRTMAESFVRHALDLHDLSERGFMNRFGGEVARAISCVPGMSAGDVARAMLGLHHRHADAVRSVLEGGYRRHAGELAAETLPPSCILRLVAGPGGVVRPLAEAQEKREPPPVDLRDFQRSSQMRLALDPRTKLVLIEGMPPIEGSTSFALLEMLAAAWEKDRQAKLAPENHAFLTARSLAKALRISETSLRRCVYRVRRRVADGFEGNAGLVLAANALIENHRWKGYRLNPAVLLIAPGELDVGAEWHNSDPPASQLRDRARGNTIG